MRGLLVPPPPPPPCRPPPGLEDDAGAHTQLQDQASDGRNSARKVTLEDAAGLNTIQQQAGEEAREKQDLTTRITDLERTMTSSGPSRLRPR